MHAKFSLIRLTALALAPFGQGALTLDRAEIIALTPKWEGERSPDGRPKVPEDILKRMEKVSLEEAWGVLRGEGYDNQFEGDWRIIHQNRVVVGRALTAAFMPARPDLNSRVEAIGKEQNRIGASNSWPIDMLREGDVYVADGYGKIIRPSCRPPTKSSQEALTSTSPATSARSRT